MFAMAGLDLPYRSRKDASRASSVRGFTRRRHGTGPTSGMDQQLWMPPMNPDLWRRDSGGRSAATGTNFNRFQDLDILPPPQAMRFQNQYQYGGSESSDGRHGRIAKDRGDHGSREAVPFDQAADALCQALHFAIKHCKNIRDSFDKEVAGSTIASWVPPKMLDGLWSMKLSWDGIDQSATVNKPNLQRTPETVTYKVVISNLLKALEDLKHCGRPRVEYLEEAEYTLSPEVFRNTMKKLECIMSGIEELTRSVRSDRSLMEHLVKDLTAAAALLGEVEDLWLPARKQRKAEKARAKWEGEDYAWAEYE